MEQKKEASKLNIEQKKKMVIHHPLDVCYDSIMDEPQQS
jgi:hypothetical protein